MKAPFLLVLSLFGLYSCNPQQNQEENKESALDQKLAAVMKIHDEVMPKMENIHTLTNKIESKIDSLKNTGAPAEELNHLQQQSERLDTAEKAMMDWMHQSIFQFEGMSEDSALMILNRQEQEIIDVKNKMLQSIDSAEAVLQNKK